jgi:hypothetical protein
VTIIPSGICRLGESWLHRGGLLLSRPYYLTIRSLKMGARSGASELIGGKATVPVEGNRDKQDPRRYKRLKSVLNRARCELTSEAYSERVR